MDQQSFLFTDFILLKQKSLSVLFEEIGKLLLCGSVKGADDVYIPNTGWPRLNVLDLIFMPTWLGGNCQVKDLTNWAVSKSFYIIM